MDFAVWPGMHRPVAEILDQARLAEELGYCGCWFADHYMPNTGTEEVASGDVHEAWGILPAAAAVTERIRIGSLVSPTSVHHPAVLANRAVTVDHVSNGRMVLGLGAGWQINEHAAYGIPLEPPKQRVDRFEEAIAIIRSLLDEERTTFEGSVYSVSDAPSDPSPVQEQLPILVGTSRPRMGRIAARYAQEWNSWGAPEAIADKLDTFGRACEQVGVDPATKRLTAQALFVLTDDQAAIDDALAGPMGASTIAGSDQQVIDALGQYAELGIDEVIIPDWTFDGSAQDRADTYRRFSTELLPQVT